ncbi:hypothetical protein C8R45DRAFT_934963 [Mycena sanguinolenta]|nr:hypothetical protein C8R45DRAFT_934963 [Mycena sanguinolenta]
MRFNPSTLAALCVFFSLSSAVVGISDSEIQARDGGKDDRDGHDNRSPCFPFILEAGCIKGRCSKSHQCELGFSLDPIRLCCVRRNNYRREDDDSYGEPVCNCPKEPVGGKNTCHCEGGGKGNGKGNKGGHGGHGGHEGGGKNGGHDGGGYDD